MTHTISVTQAHIDAGKQMECECCPVALALQERFGPAAFSGARQFVLGEEEGATWYPLPDAARAFIQKFDAGDPVAPFTFDVEINQ